MKRSVDFKRLIAIIGLIVVVIAVGIALLSSRINGSHQPSLVSVSATPSPTVDPDPKDAPAYTNRGNFYLSQSKDDLALADYNQAIILDPKYADAYYNRGNVYIDQGKLDLALVDFNQTVALDPKYALAYSIRGELYRHQGKLDLALADFNQAITLDPKIPTSYAGRGTVYADQKRYADALKDFQHYIDLGGNDLRAKIMIDVVKGQLGTLTPSP